MLLEVHQPIVYFMAGLVNYCVPAGKAYIKALQVARDINQKVGDMLAFFHFQEFAKTSVHGKDSHDNHYGTLPK